MTRARKGLLAIRDVKTNPYKLIAALIVNHKKEIGILTNEITYHKSSEFPICDRYQTGSTITKEKIKKVLYPNGITLFKRLRKRSNQANIEENQKEENQQKKKSKFP